MTTRISKPGIRPAPRRLFEGPGAPGPGLPALVSVTLAVEKDRGTARDARTTLGGVAPAPYQSKLAEEALRGTPVETLDPGAIGDLALRDARPLKDNH